MKLVTIFDLDGVLIDNVDYERAVTEHIVNSISSSQMLTHEESLHKWNTTLAAHSQHPRWHDYSIHCAALGVPQAWRASHLAMRHLLRAMPMATEALAVAHQAGACWLASDATSWVALYKLHAAGIDRRHFEEIFTLDRCSVDKGDPAFWECLASRLGDSRAATIYIDNRVDRLLCASRILPNCRMVHVVAEDHPSSLQLFPRPLHAAELPIRHLTHEELPDSLQFIIRDIAS